MSDLFIPKKIKVGYQNRDGTYTKKLAYVIYFDNKGVLRKEKSWESWRDKSIEPEEYENTPQDGFVLNKGIQRYGWSHFSSNRSYIRIYDPRGIEFEITPENLIGILMETTCSKRGLDGQFIYAWSGTELVLLPCGSEEYQKAVTYTERQDQNISAKDLKPGCSYTTKKGEELIYIGRYKWYEYKSDYYSGQGKRKCKKQHIFSYTVTPKYKYNFFPKDDISFLATLNNTDPVQNYADLIDSFNGCPHSSEIVRWEVEPIENFSLATKMSGYPGREIEVLEKNNYLELDGDIINFWHIDIAREYNKQTNAHEIKGHTLHKSSDFNIKTLHSRRNNQYQNHHYDYNYNKIPITPDNDIIEKSKIC